jgi:ubiquinone biosynthesis protein COQ4
MNMATLVSQTDEDKTPQPQGRSIKPEEVKYLQGPKEPVTSSVLISNSKYLNSPIYRDAYIQQSLRRNGRDLAPTYVIPFMGRALQDTTDYAEFAVLLAEEKQKNPEFAKWLDARRWTSYKADELVQYGDNTLGGTIRLFLSNSGMNMEFLNPTEPKDDLQYLQQRRGVLHDIEHMVTGFGPYSAGEQALSICNVTAVSRYFSPKFAQYLSHPNYFVSSAGYMRAALHYHEVMPTYLDAMRQGITVGMALKKPLFLVEWENYLGWDLEDLAAHLGIVRGPGDTWAWTDDACSG